MFINYINNNQYKAKILNYRDNFDFDNFEYLLKKILTKIIKKKKLYGLLLLNIYTDDNYGIIIDVENIKKTFNFSKNIELKLNLNLDTIFLYKVNDISIINKTNYIDVYYYKDNFYIHINNKMLMNEYLNLLEISNDIIYKDSDIIIKNGLKIK